MAVSVIAGVFAVTDENSSGFLNLPYASYVSGFIPSLSFCNPATISSVLKRLNSSIVNMGAEKKHVRRAKTILFHYEKPLLFFCFIIYCVSALPCLEGGFGGPGGPGGPGVTAP